MNKDTIELKRIEKLPYGYFATNPPQENSSATLDAIVEWAQNHPKAKVYKHLVRHRYENDKGKEYDFAANGWQMNNERPKGITECDLVFYLDIYWQ